MSHSSTSRTLAATPPRRFTMYALDISRVRGYRNRNSIRGRFSPNLPPSLNASASSNPTTATFVTSSGNAVSDIISGNTASPTPAWLYTRFVRAVFSPVANLRSSMSRYRDSRSSPSAISENAEIQASKRARASVLVPVSSNRLPYPCPSNAHHRIVDDIAISVRKVTALVTVSESTVHAIPPSSVSTGLSMMPTSTICLRDAANLMNSPASG